MQNTFERAVLAIITHLIVAATFNRSIVMVKVLASMFGIGRLLFWVGYKHGARGRAFGFALTFYPSVLALVASAAVPMVGCGRLADQLLSDEPTAALVEIKCSKLRPQKSSNGRSRSDSFRKATMRYVPFSNVRHR